jgi:hypothetical protein
LDVPRQRENEKYREGRVSREAERKGPRPLETNIKISRNRQIDIKINKYRFALPCLALLCLALLQSGPPLNPPPVAAAPDKATVPLSTGAGSSIVARWAGSKKEDKNSKKLMAIIAVVRT